jgi:arginine exporter protein ArgO
LDYAIVVFGGAIMKKSKSTGYYIFAIMWILVSLMWFFCVKNIPIGFIWLTMGVFELAIAASVRKKEKK